MKVNGLVMCVMDLECRLGQMVLDMKASGKKTKLVAKENSIMLMVTLTMVNGVMIKQMGMGLIFMLMGQNMMVNGKMISKTASE